MRIEAKEVTEEKIKGIGDFYVLIFSKTVDFEDLMPAVNLFHEQGWTCVNVTASITQWHWRMYALMRRN